jgi:hypothetical protein
LRHDHTIGRDSAGRCWQTCQPYLTNVVQANEEWSSVAVVRLGREPAIDIDDGPGHVRSRRPGKKEYASSDLPRDVSPADLANFITTVSDGISVKAKFGASRQALRRVAEMALRVWPG